MPKGAAKKGKCNEQVNHGMLRIKSCTHGQTKTTGKSERWLVGKLQAGFFKKRKQGENGARGGFTETPEKWLGKRSIGEIPGWWPLWGKNLKVGGYRRNWKHRAKKKTGTLQRLFQTQKAKETEEKKAIRFLQVWSNLGRPGNPSSRTCKSYSKRGGGENGWFGQREVGNVGGDARK